MSKAVRKWSKLALLLLPGAGISYYAYGKYRLKHEKALPLGEILPPLEVTYKPLPQYGKNFKVAQCLGYTLPDFVDVNAVRNFASRPSDVWVVSYPKSGTTWVQEIVYLLVNRKFKRGHLLGSIKDAIASNLDDRVPFIEFPCTGIATIDQLPSPRIIKSHLPLQLLPPSVLQTPTVKIIYVTRNPRDVAVSLYHFMDILTEVQMAENFGFSDFVEDFLSGDLPYSPYSAHVGSYVKALEGEGVRKKILVIRYEDLKFDLKRQVARIGRFLGFLDLDDEDWKWLRHYTSFDVMKTMKTSNYSWFNDLGIIKKDRTFMRKGVVGDWENHLTEEQATRFEKEIEQPLDQLTGHLNPVFPE